MLAKIRAFFTEEIGGDNNLPMPRDRLHLAAAALMIEVATADEHYDASELDTLKGILRHTFDLNQARIDELAKLALEEKDNAVSLYQFTHLINEFASPEEKFEILLGMWKIAYADGSVDKYEEHVIRKVSDLIYVSHSDFVRAKLMARDGANQ